jgi:hemerythrin
MALTAWSSEYSVGVEELDRQHRMLFDILNDLHAAMMQGKAQSLTGELLRKLIDYTRKHFSAEEAMMAAAGYSGLAQHRLQHKDLMKQVDEFAGRFERGEKALNVQLMNFLRDWLTTHIQHSDRAYTPALNKHSGVKMRGAV